MKLYRVALMFAGAALLLSGPGVKAYAFHDGGVAYCDGCHTMHNSSSGGAMTVGGNNPLSGNGYLLQGTDQSSTCLKCHSNNDTAPNSYHVVTYPIPGGGTPPSELTPGGDFAYLQKPYSWTNSDNTTGSSLGERHGHNIIAKDFGFVADGTLNYAPGGSYPNTGLMCISCHDPHGKARIVDSAGTVARPAAGTAVPPITGSGTYGAMPASGQAVGVYRLLGGVGYQPASVSGGFAFTADPPYAVSPADYNRPEDAAETRVAYGSGMSEWCSNCHTGIHNGSSTGSNIHPAGNAVKLPSGIITNYNAYVRSDDLTGTIATAYTSMVPYEEGSTDRAALAAHAVIDGSVAVGPDVNSNVMCLTCHRAHAAAWDSATRWNNKAEFITVGGDWPGTDASGQGARGEYSTGKTRAEYQAAMYGRPATKYATFQRLLCNKCHVKD